MNKEYENNNFENVSTPEDENPVYPANGRTDDPSNEQPASFLQGDPHTASDGEVFPSVAPSVDPVSSNPADQPQNESSGSGFFDGESSEWTEDETSYEDISSGNPYENQTSQQAEEAYTASAQSSYPAQGSQTGQQGNASSDYGSYNDQPADPNSDPNMNYSGQADQSGYQYNQEYPYSASYGPQANPYQNSYYGYNPVQPPEGPSEPEQKARKERKKGGMGLKIAAIALVCALAGGAVGGISTYALVSSGKTPNSSLNNGNTVQNVKIDDSYNSSVEAIADKVLPSVVGIKTTYRQSSGGSMFGFGGGQSSEASAEGSGVVYSQDGYIITNYHVVQEASTSSGGSISVYLNDDKDESFPATLVGYDAGADLAVLKIEKTGLTPIEFGDSASLKVGQLAVAIGNPGGLDFMGSVSQGIVSGLNRTITLESGVSMELIQTDAAINPGNSGGALVDGTGKLIGINSAKLASDGFEGMGFAIPSDDVKTIVDRLINNQGKKSAYLGISIDSRYTTETLEQMGYPSGVVVASVVEGGPAESAGLKQGDIITTVEGTAIPSYDILVSELTKYSPGDQVKMEVFRLSQTQEITVTLGETSSQQSSTSSR